MKLPEQAHYNRPPLTMRELFGVDIYDSSGVPLDSDRARDTRGIDFEYVACPFEDSPSRTTHNVRQVPMSRLEERRLDEHFRDICRLIGTISLDYSMSGGPDPEGYAHVDLLKIFSVAKYLPHYLVVKESSFSDSDRDLSPGIVIGSNAAAGASAAVSSYVDTYEESFSFACASAEQYSETVEGTDRMIGDQTVCVAKPSRIKAYIQAAVSPRGQRYETPYSLIEFPRILGFASAMLELRLSTDPLKMHTQLAPLLRNMERAQIVDMFQSVFLSADQSLQDAAMYAGRRRPVRPIKIQDLRYVLNPEEYSAFVESLGSDEAVSEINRLVSRRSLSI